MGLHVDIRKHFPSFDLEVALDAGDEVFGLLGASGCGKTLTMRCIAGIETPDEGRITVNDQVFYDSAANVNLKPQQRKTALLFQNYMLFPNLTVEQNVGAGIPRDISKEERDALVREELHRFDVEVFAKRYPAQLSGGQQQRVALARMLAARPGILMLDEPFSALDAHLKTVLEQNLSSLFDAFRGTILYVSHDIDEAVRFCDRIAVVERGRVVETKASRELIDHPESMAGLKLSGCKNVATAERMDDEHVRCPQWGVTLRVPGPVPPDVLGIGVRAFRIERAEVGAAGAVGDAAARDTARGATAVPGAARVAKANASMPLRDSNIFRMRVDRTSDSRFERMCLLSFLDREPGAQPLVQAADQEMHFLHQRVFWRINMLYDQGPLPEAGDELLVRIPVEHIYVVTR